MPHYDDLLGTTESRFDIGPASQRVTLVCDQSANILGLRNGANPNGLTIYNTFTDVANYERAYLGWQSNEFLVYAQETGSGSPRNIRVGTIGQLAVLQQQGGSLGETRLTMTSEFPVLGAILESFAHGLFDLNFKGASVGSSNLRMEARTDNDFLLAPEWQ